MIDRSKFIPEKEESADGDFDIVAGQGVVDCKSENINEQTSRLFHISKHLLLVTPPIVEKVDARYVLQLPALKAAASLLKARLPLDIVSMIEPFCISIPPPDEFIYYLDGLRLPGGTELLRRGSSQFRPRGEWEGMPIFTFSYTLNLLLIDDDTALIYVWPTLGCTVLHLKAWTLDCKNHMAPSLPCLQQPKMIKIDLTTYDMSLLDRFTKFINERGM
jgi:hypothetical protein